MKIGIIGFGRFGKLLTQYLSKKFNVFVFDTKNKQREIKKIGAIPASLAQACKKDVIILCVPISRFEKVLIKIKKLIKDNQLVVDVCSVKEYPVKLMKKILPKKVQILATHPIFGPDSAAKSLKGNKIVLCKARIQDGKYKKIKAYLKKMGLTVIETTPAKHDRDIARSLLLTHFIGRGLIDFGSRSMYMDTEGYKRLMSILEMVQNDTSQLFHDMNKYNKYSNKMRQHFIKSLENVHKGLKK